MIPSSRVGRRTPRFTVFVRKKEKQEKNTTPRVEPGTKRQWIWRSAYATIISDACLLLCQLFIHPGCQIFATCQLSIQFFLATTKKGVKLFYFIQNSQNTSTRPTTIIEDSKPYTSTRLTVIKFKNRSTMIFLFSWRCRKIPLFSHFSAFFF